MGEFDEGEKTESRPSCVLVCSSMWLAISTRPDIFIAVPSASRDYSAPKAIPWKAALGTLAYINNTSGFGIIYQREASAGIYLEVFADADYASKAIDRRSVSGGANNVWRCMCVLVFQDPEVCHPFCWHSILVFTANSLRLVNSQYKTSTWKGLSEYAAVVVSDFAAELGP